MKGKVKKNQLIIVALAVMIAAAGYLNYTGRLFTYASVSFKPLTCAYAKSKILIPIPTVILLYT